MEVVLSMSFRFFIAPNPILIIIFSLFLSYEQMAESYESYPEVQINF